MDQPVDEAVPDKNQGTGNGLLPVTEVQRAVCENPRNWREATVIEKKEDEHLYIHYSYSMALGF